ncbi:MAG: SUMF1/EgtB/PvdO family nonheme iron enzyme, partial [Myxococcales bacterium]
MIEQSLKRRIGSLLGCVLVAAVAAVPTGMGCGGTAPAKPAAAPLPSVPDAAPLASVPVEIANDTAPEQRPPLEVKLKAPTEVLTRQDAEVFSVEVTVTGASEGTLVTVQLDGHAPKRLWSLPGRVELAELGPVPVGEHVLQAYATAANGRLHRTAEGKAVGALARFKVVKVLESPPARRDVVVPPRDCGPCGEGAVLLVHEPAATGNVESLPVDVALVGTEPGSRVRLRLQGGGQEHTLYSDGKGPKRITGLGPGSYTAAFDVVDGKGQSVPLLHAARSVAFTVASGPAPAALSCPEGMVAIAGGTYQMGAAEGNEWPVHTVTVSPFCMDRTEVTVQAYEACNACSTKDLGEQGCNWGKLDLGDHP